MTCVENSQLREDYSELELVRDGKSCCTVVIAQGAGEKVKTAADDFCSLLRQMTGAVCSVKTDDQCLSGGLVCIGPSRLTMEMGIPTPTGRFSNERVILKRDGDRLALLGNDDNHFTGTQFAVTMLPRLRLVRPGSLMARDPEEKGPVDRVSGYRPYPGLHFPV